MNKFKYIILLVIGLCLCQVSRSQIKLSPYVSYGMESINYEYPNTTQSNYSGIGFGADIMYHISEYVIIGSGIKINTYGVSTSVGNISMEQTVTDIDGDQSLLTFNGESIEEEYTMSAIEIPLFARYQRWINSDMILYGATGPVFTIAGAVNSDMTGTIMSEAYYDEWNLTLKDVEEYNAYSKQLSNSESETELKSSFGWLIELGTEYYISKRLNIALGVYYQPGLSNISNGSESSSLMADPNNYAGSLNGADKVTLTKAGFRLGINFDLTPNQRSSVKSIR